MISKIDRGLLIIIITPLLLLLTNSNWIFSYIGAIDPWVYHGYFLNFTQHLQMFAGTYYGTRLSWILPGYFLYRLFPPLVANYILHLGFYYLSVISLYLILKYTINSRVALLTSILMGCHAYFLWAIGWDYWDGPGITYFLLTLLLLTYASKSVRWQIALCLSGFFFAALVYSNTFTVIFIPFVALFYLFTNSKYRKNPIYHSLGLFSIGLVGLTLLLGAINYVAGGEFLFFLPSFSIAAGLLNRANPWRDLSYSWLARAIWLVVPTATFMVSVLSLLLSRLKRSSTTHPFALFFQLQYILMVLAWVVIESMGQPVLEYKYYAAYLVPGMFLAIGSLLADILSGLTQKQFIVVVCSAILFWVLPFAPPVLSFRQYLFTFGLLVPVTTALLGMLLLLVKFSRTWATGLFILWWSITNFALTDVGQFTQPSLSYSKQEAFLAITESMRTIQTVIPDGQVFFWYDVNEPLGPVYRSTASTFLWGYRLINEKFPSTEAWVNEANNRIAPNTRVAILSTGRDALAKARESLSQIGLDAQMISARNIEVGRIGFALTFIQVATDARRLEDELTYVSAHLDDWVKTDAAPLVVVNPQMSSVKITTNYSTYDWQLVSPPIRLDPQAKYFVRFPLRIESGGAGVHVIGADRQTVLATHYWCRPRSDFGNEEFVFDAGNNDTVILAISNCGNPKPAVSTFWLGSLEIRKAREYK